MKNLLFIIIIFVLFNFALSNLRRETISHDIHLKNLSPRLKQYIEWNKKTKNAQGSFLSRMKHRFNSLINLKNRNLNNMNDLKNYSLNQFRTFTLDSLIEIANTDPIRARNIAFFSFHSDLTFIKDQQLYIVQFKENINENHHNLMKEKFGIYLNHYIPDNSFILLLPTDLALEIQNLNQVLQVIPLTKESKLGFDQTNEETFDKLNNMKFKKFDLSKFENENLKSFNLTNENFQNNYNNLESHLSKENINKSNSIKFNQKALVTMWMLPFKDSLIDSEKSKIELKLIQEEWIQNVYTYLGDNSNKIKHQILDYDRISFSADSEHLLNEIASLSIGHSYVYWVQKVNIYGESMLKYAVPISKTGTENDIIFKPFGLTGNNVLIGISDSGLDTNSCFFYDSTKPIPFVNKITDVEATTSHRKLVSYWRLVDGLDSALGHGTHVSSTVLGKTQYTGLSEFNGVAEDAKVIFTDLGCSTPEGCQCDNVEGCPCIYYPNSKCVEHPASIYIPPNSDVILNFHRSRGARISSFSIGFLNIMSGYDQHSYLMDKFAYENDHLNIFSSGNYGNNEGYSTLCGSFTETKNSLVVGAESNSNSAFMYQISRIDYNNLAKLVANGIYNDNLCNLKINLPNKTIDDYPICKLAFDMFNSENPEEFCYTNVLKNCTLNIVDYFEQILVKFNNLNTIIDLTCSRKCAEKLATDGSIAFGKGSLALFSSIGPTLDGRIKPDVVSIGNKIRASNALSGTCSNVKAENIDNNLQDQYGTSMSTPMVAGLAAIAYQYFADGYYPTGEKTNPKFIPSASLIKAIIIESSRPLPNLLRATPSYILYSNSISPYQRTHFEGFGSVNLYNVLKMKNGAQQFKLYVSDKKTIKTNYQHIYLLTIPKNAQYLKLSATLVWTDKEAKPLSSKALVNDLDLIIVNELDNKFYYGNNGIENDKRYDQDNNVEKVSIDVKPGYTYKVKVIGINVPFNQKYSLVLTHGANDEILMEESIYIENPFIIAFYLSITVIVILVSVCLLGICNLCSCCGHVFQSVFGLNLRFSNSRSKGAALLEDYELHE